MLSCGLSLWRSAVAGGGTPPDPILAAFANGEQGAYYDFSDLSSVLVGTVTTSAVTTNGQTVSSVIDKKRPYAPTQYPTTGWVKISGDGVVSVVGNVITITGATTQTRVQPAPGNFRPMANGLTRLRVTYISGSATLLSYVVGVPTVIASPGVTDATQAHSNLLLIDLVQIASGTVSFSIDEYSFMPANNLLQITAAQRPLFELSSGIGAIVGDGIDKHMQTGPIDLSHTDRVTLMVATRNISGTDKLLARMGTSATSAGSWYLSSEYGYTANIGGSGHRQRRTGGSQLSTVGIIEAVFDRTDATSPTITINGTPITGTMDTSGSITGDFSASNLLSLLAGWSGSAAVDASNAALNKALFIDRILSASERLAIRQKWAAELGIVL